MAITNLSKLGIQNSPESKRHLVAPLLKRIYSTTSILGGRVQSFEKLCLNDFNEAEMEEFDPSELFDMEKGSSIAILPSQWNKATLNDLFILYDFETCPYTNYDVASIISVEDFMQDWHHEYRKLLNPDVLDNIKSENLKFFRKKKRNTLKFMEDDL